MANTEPRPKSLPVRVFGADTEAPKPKCFDEAQQDEALWEAIADQEALLALEKELRSYTGQWQYCFFWTRSYQSCSENK